MDEEQSYWKRARSARLTRRRFVVSGVTGTAAAALLAAGCGGASNKQTQQQGTVSAPATPSGTPIAGGTLAVSQTTNAPTLDPQRTTSFYTLLPSSAVYSRPLRFKTGVDPSVAENHDVESDLALTAESPDAVTWTLKLRPNAKFQNVPPVSGHAVEAEDIKATFVRAAGKDNPARSGLDMMDPAQIDTPDKSTVVFKLKYPYAPFQSTLASPNYAWIFPREATAGDYDPAKTMIGSGPFLFDTYTPDVAFTFKRNPDWFGAPQPNVAAVRWAIIPDSTQQRAQFLGGNLDLLGTSGGVAISPFDVATLRHDAPKAAVVKANPSAGQLMFVQLGDPSSPFQDIRVRQAFSLGIDRDAIAKAIYNDDAVEQFFAPLSMGKWAMRASDLPSDTAQYYKYDPAQAKKLIEASGVASQQFKLIYITSFLGPAYEQAAQTAVNMLQGAGIKITAVSIDYVKDYIGGGKGVRYGNYDNHSLVFTGLSNFTDIDEYISNYFYSKATSGLSHLNDPNVDSALTKARTTVNTDDRVKAYIDLQKYIASKVYAIAGLHLPYVYTFAAPRVQNYCPDISYGLGTETFSKLWFSG